MPWGCVDFTGQHNLAELSCPTVPTGMAEARLLWTAERTGEREIWRGITALAWPSLQGDAEATRMPGENATGSPRFGLARTDGLAITARLPELDPSPGEQAGLPAIRTLTGARRLPPSGLGASAEDAGARRLPPILRPSVRTREALVIEDVGSVTDGRRRLSPEQPRDPSRGRRRPCTEAESCTAGSE